jgi:hypothetical protein
MAQVPNRVWPFQAFPTVNAQVIYGTTQISGAMVLEGRSITNQAMWYSSSQGAVGIPSGSMLPGEMILATGAMTTTTAGQTIMFICVPIGIGTGASGRTVTHIYAITGSFVSTGSSQ